MHEWLVLINTLTQLGFSVFVAAFLLLRLEVVLRKLEENEARELEMMRELLDRERHRG